ncbi:enoyl-CoA hydratase [Methylobrevis albus]|uniref:Enoyl-CoA hydratase domain-containing protein 3, mitochondrial n=1 Tax=Methylobrevis albus TaxID=2793297 RepID=A0A931N0H7_9HYPH|nr:enoyl-CoA hydratase [Methylobrevis albus]MBH0239214.1 enoyl-CoA hydratase [Methylobrevis albus]
MTVATSPRLAISSDGAVLRLTLVDSARRNALSEAMIADIAATLAAAADDPTIGVVVIAAEGPAFCAGHDLKELTAHRSAPDAGRAAFARIMSACSALMLAIVHFPKPVIAEVRGVATAAGCQLVATCDLALAGPHARFATPGVNIGLFCSTPMVALSRAVPRKAAMEMLLTGDMIDAERAAAIGLVNRVVADDDLTAETMALAGRIAAKSGRTLKIGKAAFQAQLDLPLADAYDHAAAVMVENMLEGDACEGIDAFIAKRRPEWAPRD